jgi:hypothetical protein
MRNTATLQLDLNDHFAVISFDRVNSKLNVLTRELWTDLQLALKEIQEDHTLQGLILQSTKPGVFLAGADIKELYPRQTGDMKSVEEFIDLGNNTLSMLESLPFPTVALIDGVCLGGGLEVTLACDLRIEGDNPKLSLGFPEVKLGLIPGWGGTQRFSRLYSSPLAAELICTGEPKTRLFDWRTDSEKLMEFGKSLLKSSSSSYQEARRRKHDPKHDVQPLDVSEYHSDNLNRQPAINEALRIIQEGIHLPFQEALKLEREAFMRLVPSTGAQTLMGEFFNRPRGG